MPPKARDAAHARAIADQLPGQAALIALIETAAGIQSATEIRLQEDGHVIGMNWWPSWITGLMLRAR
jgi:citrate lyase beta subunit